jgi:hypothetical protein
MIVLHRRKDPAMAAVDSLTKTASRMLAGSGIDLDPVFPDEVDDGFRWGVARLPRPGQAAKIEVLVGVPTNGRFTAEDLVTAFREGAQDLLALTADEDLEVGSFRFEIY